MEGKRSKMVEMEFVINSTPSIVYQRLSTPHGLSEWFANDVNTAGNVFTFIWDDDTRQAELVEHQRNRLVRFRWLGDDEEEREADCGFAFELDRDELTGALSLRVTEEIDALADDEDDTVSLWEHQVGALKRALGCVG
ncbi:MAG: SRPBCC domain-containing protein [Bacteroidales bacterium]|nr:SRPBCC domain-containing protein [Bacteroidales bacterium]